MNCTNCEQLRKELSESNEYARKLNLKIADLCKERDALKVINDRANLDWADDDTKLREMCQKVGIPQSLIDGDTHYVPHIVGLGELLVQKIEGLRAKVARFEEVPENATMADLVQNCRVLSVERDCALKEIGELRGIIVELTAAGNCVEGDKMNLAMAIRDVGGTANVKWSTDNWNNAKDWDRRKK
jgi:hypothetical protein